MALVETAVYNLLGVFHKYSAQEGDNLKLNRSELSILLANELPCCYRDDAIMMLDLDGDGQVDFMEFIEFITDVTTELQDMYIYNLVRYKRGTKFGAQTRSEKAIVSLIKVFYKYAGKGGDPYNLETKELKQLLRKEMPTLHPCLEGNNHFREILSNLESKRKGTVDFKEFMSFVANFAVAVEFSFVNAPDSDDD
ncbi:protein S100-A11-like [Dendropsophus ebraccatus]|uniref:protein S100-A11-like n=1 Tax=Dendropsophus ebraccatus TaxID=150705 RepID=UPI003831CEA8